MSVIFFKPPNKITQEYSPGHNIPYFVINNDFVILPLPRSRFSRDANGTIPSLARLNGRVVPTVRLLRLKYKHRIIFIPHYEFDSLQGGNKGMAPIKYLCACFELYFHYGRSTMNRSSLINNKKLEKYSGLFKN